MAGPDKRHRHGRRRAKKRASIAGPLALAVVLVLGATAGYAAWHKSRASEGSAALDTGTTATSAPPTSGTTADGDRSPTPKGTTTSPKATKKAAKPRTSATTSAPPASVPKHGTGTFSVARASGSASGHGTIRRYKVEVEGGISLSPTDAAHEIAVILADPRGWTADGHDGFQLVSSGPADFVIKIATPDTVDRICGAAGLLTHGEVNCDVGATVVVNLKRWMLGSPEFDGPIAGYRALIINHEVGHRIGHHHEGCPGPGKPAPVMMQQIKGLHGCVANQWPYDSRGRYISGPPAA